LTVETDLVGYVDFVIGTSFHRSKYLIQNAPVAPLRQCQKTRFACRVRDGRPFLVEVPQLSGIEAAPTSLAQLRWCRNRKPIAWLFSRA